jgi:hypothetical protein
MHAITTHSAGLGEFPAGSDLHWETERRLVWNDQRHTGEECELVYEISWIAEIGVWRRFLRSQQRVSG